MATVFRADGKFRAQVRVKGRSLTRTFTHKRDAQLWASDQERGIVAGRGGGGTGRGWYLADLIARYLQDLPCMGLSDIRSKVAQVGWWNQHYGDTKLVDITPALISEARDKLMRTPTHRGTPRTGATTNRYLAALGAALKAGVRRYHCIDQSPMKDVEKGARTTTSGAR